MSQEPSISVPRRTRSGRLRASVVGVLTLISMGLSGCGDPDDGDGDGGGTGYLAQQVSERTTAPGNR